jgi:hypothetical protein
MITKREKVADPEKIKETEEWKRLEREAEKKKKEEK